MSQETEHENVGKVMKIPDFGFFNFLGKPLEEDKLGMISVLATLLPNDSFHSNAVLLLERRENYCKLHVVSYTPHYNHFSSFNSAFGSCTSFHQTLSFHASPPKTFRLFPCAASDMKHEVRHQNKFKNSQTTRSTVRNMFIMSHVVSRT